MSHVRVRHAEPEDYEAMHRIMSAPKVAMGTLQLPLQPAEAWRKRLAEPPEGLFLLVACVEGEVVGNLGLETSPNRPRVRHVGSIGMAVHDDWQGHRDGAYGEGAGSGGQLAQPFQGRADGLHGQRRRRGRGVLRTSD